MHRSSRMIEFRGAWRTSNKSAASNSPPEVCRIEVVTQRSRKCASAPLYMNHTFHPVVTGTFSSNFEEAVNLQNYHGTPKL
ncbi:hypothetical protein TNCV_1913531 [Trichonephila clavipes]|nr:hypothetical protein TNCV_1913531 [Trichonephila clavipes]